MKLFPLAEVERPKGKTTTQATISRLAEVVRHSHAEMRSAEARLRQTLFTLWVSNVMVKGKVTPSWVLLGFVTFEDWMRVLGVPVEFSRRAVIVQREFYEAGGLFSGFKKDLALSVSKMYQVYRVARGVREANDWLQVAATSTTEEMERLIRAELGERAGHDVRSMTIAMHLKDGNDVADYLMFRKDSVIVHGHERVDTQLMRAVRFYQAHQLNQKVQQSKKNLRAA